MASPSQKMKQQAQKLQRDASDMLLQSKLTMNQVESVQDDLEKLELAVKAEQEALEARNLSARARAMVEGR